MSGGARGSLLLAWSLVAASPLQGQWVLRDGDDWTVELGGYVQALSAVQDVGFDIPDVERRSAFHGEVVRLKWTARGEGWVLEVHDRLQSQLTSSDQAVGSSVVGFGVSAVPERSLDLETTLAEGDRYRVWHDVDRLALTLYTGAADVTLGRQAITWGISSLFPVADLWSRFSPFELDTEEKPGIDAVRVLAYPAAGLEVDGVMADRGSLDDLSAGVRASWSLAEADVYAAAGKFWRELIVLAGGTYLLEEVRLRVEAAFPFEPDGGGASRPRATAGFDLLRGSWVVAAELHYNGIGEDTPGEYVDVLSDPRFGRGETYYLGRLLGGFLVSHTTTDRLTLSLSALGNLRDPSLALTPAVAYDVGQSARISLGGLLSFGEEPSFPSEGLPSLGSEFGTYGSLGYTQVSVYF
ncbi:MAG TPA: hypothetical protein VLL48_12985 [Longimicrobiales bacterium]|nr:hypothetical protein [Longimicrobiales bacterium]